MVAEPVTEATPIIETPAVSPTTGPTEAKGEGTEGLLEQVTEPKAPSTEGDAGEFSLDDLDEWKALTGGVEEKPAEIKLPGRALEEVEQELKDARARNYRGFMESGEAWVVERAKAPALGFSEDDAKAIWQNFVQPALNALHADHEDYSNKLDNEHARLALSEEDQNLYFGKQYADRIEGKKALVALGEGKANQAWEARVKSDYIPRSALATLKTSIETAFRKRLEDAGLIKGAESGEHVPGEQASPGGPLTLEEAMHLPVEKLPARLGR